MTKEPSVCHVDYEMSNDNLLNDIQRLVRDSIPTWKNYDLQIETLSGGYINTMVRCWRSEKPKKSLVIRVWCNTMNGTFFDNRDLEVQFCQALSEKGCFPVLVATFKNGYCYQRYEGNIIGDMLDVLKEDSYLSAVTKGFVMCHTTDIPGVPKKSNYFQKARDNLSKTSNTNMMKIRHYVPYLTKEFLFEELDLLEEEIKKLDSPVVLCHMDCQVRNILWNQRDDHVTFVDCEMTKFEYQAVDLAYHFVSFYWEVLIDDFKKIPLSMESYRRRFIRYYLRHWFKAKGKNPDDVQELDVENMLLTVKKFMLTVNFYMVCICSNMKKLEKVDIYKFAADRFKDYERMKSKYLSFQVPKNGV